MKQLKMKRKNKYLPVLLGTLAANMLGNLLARKGVIRASEGIIRSGQDF